MQGVPESFAARQTPQGMVLSIAGEEWGTPIAGLVMTLGAVAVGFAGPGVVCWALAALLAVFTTVVGVQAALSHDLELALDEVRLVKRLGALRLKVSRVALSRVTEVRINNKRTMALRVIELDTPDGPLRILADGHSVEDTDWLRDTLQAMVEAARPLDEPEPPDDLQRLRGRGQRQSEPTSR